MRPRPPLGAASVFAPPAASRPSQDALEPRSSASIFARMFVISSLGFGVPMGGLFGGLAFVLGQVPGYHVPLAMAALGVMFGGPFSAFMLIFQREVAVELPVTSPAGFEARLRAALETARYRPPAPDGDILVSRPTWRAGEASGRIRIGVRGERARLVGPRLYVEKVVRAMGEEA